MTHGNHTARARVLIVEDERITAADLQLSVAKLGYSVVASVATAEEAIDRAGQCKPDIVIMDVRLRGPMDGVEAGIRIHARWTIPIIYLSAFLDSEVRNRARETAVACLVKPYDLDALRAALERASGPENKPQERISA